MTDLPLTLTFTLSQQAVYTASRALSAAMVLGLPAKTGGQPARSKTVRTHLRDTAIWIGVFLIALAGFQALSRTGFSVSQIAWHVVVYFGITFALGVAIAMLGVEMLTRRIMRKAAAHMAEEGEWTVTLTDSHIEEASAFSTRKAHLSRIMGVVDYDEGTVIALGSIGIVVPDQALPQTMSRHAFQDLVRSLVSAGKAAS